jgi:hypothetical protein
MPAGEEGATRSREKMEGWDCMNPSSLPRLVVLVFATRKTTHRITALVPHWQAFGFQRHRVAYTTTNLIVLCRKSGIVRSGLCPREVPHHFRDDDVNLSFRTSRTIARFSTAPASVPSQHVARSEKATRPDSDPEAGSLRGPRPIFSAKKLIPLSEREAFNFWAIITYCALRASRSHF